MAAAPSAASDTTIGTIIGISVPAIIHIIIIIMTTPHQQQQQQQQQHAAS